jgi:MoxR-like ATPase
MRLDHEQPLAETPFAGPAGQALPTWEGVVRTTIKPGSPTRAEAEPAAIATASPLLARLGVIGLEAIEPVVLAALITAEPLLLVGPHGTGKSYLLVRLARALGMTWRHYNAALVNFDDLVGYPLPGPDGRLTFVRTPASIWDVEAVFLDEISRCRVDLQNKLFPIIHERRVQGILLERLVYRWSAMNPPADDEDEGGYRGSEPLDLALADRFALVVEMPAWERLDESRQEAIICAGDEAVDPVAAAALRSRVEAGKLLLPRLHAELERKLSVYVRLVAALLRQGGVVLSPRRAGMLLRNIVAVHAARLLGRPDAAVRESALLALSHSLPQRVTGEAVPDRVKLLTVHREAFAAVDLPDDDPRRVLLLEPDPLRRALWAARLPALPPADFSTVVADSLAMLPPGARHALALELFASGAADRLVAAVAEQCARLYTVVASPQELIESVQARGVRHQVWQKVVATLAKMDREDDTPLATNLLVGLFAAGELATEVDVDRVLAAWHDARMRGREVAA